MGLESLSDASKAVCSGWVAIASMYGTSTYVWLTFMGVNLSKYTTHASYGYLYIYICSIKQRKKEKEAPWLFWWSRSLGDESLLSGNQLG